MKEATSTPTLPEAAPPQAEMARALDISDYVSGPAGEAWALIAQLFFTDGKPRFPAIAQELDLHPGQAIVLRLLSEPRMMSELAGAMHCDNSNITGIVDRLEERGLVERQAADYDRRVKRIAITRAGSRLRDELHRRLAEPPEQLTRLSTSDLRTLRRILAQVTTDQG
jgi:DNA-binding MarR family transcriptional regulator